MKSSHCTVQVWLQSQLLCAMLLVVLCVACEVILIIIIIINRHFKNAQLTINCYKGTHDTANIITLVVVCVSSFRGFCYSIAWLCTIAMLCIYHLIVAVFAVVAAAAE